MRKNMYNLLSFKFILINVILSLFFGLAAANDQELKTPIEISQLNFKLTPIEKTWLKNLQLDWPHRDPADRTIVTTATLLSCPLITSDGVIRSFYAETIW